MNDKLTAIADEIIGSSDGTYDIQYTEAYDALTLEEQNTVQKLVYEEIVSCDSCGCNFNANNLEWVPGHGELCWSCADDVAAEEEEEDEEEEDEEDGQPDEAQEWQDFDPDC